MSSLGDFLSGIFGGGQGGQPYTGPRYQTAHMRGGASRHRSGDSTLGMFSPEQLWSYNAYKNAGGHHTPGGWYAMSDKGQYHVGGNNLRLNEDGTQRFGPLRVPPGYSGTGTVTTNKIGGGNPKNDAVVKALTKSGRGGGRGAPMGRAR